jgi:hypothetical protein
MSQSCLWVNYDTIFENKFNFPLPFGTECGTPKLTDFRSYKGVYQLTNLSQLKSSCLCQWHVLFKLFDDHALSFSNTCNKILYCMPTLATKYCIACQHLQLAHIWKYLLFSILIPDPCNKIFPWTSPKGPFGTECGAIILLVDYWNYWWLLVKLPDHLIMQKPIYWQYFSRCSAENKIIAIKYCPLGSAKGLFKMFQWHIFGLGCFNLPT